MGVRENKVEKYLDTKIVELGGITRKWVSPGVDGVPDRLCAHRDHQPVAVEVKTVDGVLEEHQDREQIRLRANGFQAVTVYGYLGVDRFIKDYFKGNLLRVEYR